MTASPSIEHLEQIWASLAALCSDLSEEEWKRPTGCPGWSVQDNIAHLIDYEARALGRPAPEATSLSLPHTKNALGEANEVGVEHRRAWSGGEVLAEFRDVTAERAAQLRALTEDDLRKEVTTPAGPGTVADMLTLRVMDTWSHEQDIRRALARPGHETGPAAQEAVEYFARYLPLVVAKRAGAPDGTTAVFDIGEIGSYGVEVVDKRGRAVDDVAAIDSPTVRLTMPAATFAALVGGRDDVPDDVVLDGDADLARSVMAALGFMP